MSRERFPLKTDRKINVKCLEGEWVCLFLLGGTHPKMVVLLLAFQRHQKGRGGGGASHPQKTDGPPKSGCFFGRPVGAQSREPGRERAEPCLYLLKAIITLLQPTWPLGSTWKMNFLLKGPHGSCYVRGKGYVFFSNKSLVGFERNSSLLDIFLLFSFCSWGLNQMEACQKTSDAFARRFRAPRWLGSDVARCGFSCKGLEGFQ